MLLGILGASLLGNLLTGIKAIRPGEGIIRAGQNVYADSFLTNFEIQKYSEIEPDFNGVYSRNNLRKIKDGA